jgi:2-keto-4-pentenoate hydratase/2-oxohepta-3-ene-1,7-dioic acid hydratase in catechol pathway
LKNIFNPTKIICTGLNYKTHSREMNMKDSAEPVIFLKPPTSLIYDGEYIVIPVMSSRVDYEAELALVVGRKCRFVKKDDAFDCIEGYTCLNDVTARDLQSIDGQWTRAKSFDTFCPVGPGVIKVKDPGNLNIRCRVNNVIRQDSNTNDLIFDIPTLFSYISNIMTLEKGDIISTGTPGGIGQIFDGDTVEVEIEGVGILKNPVKAYDGKK